MLIRTPAIVLRQQDLGEADQIIRFFSEALGQISVVARGIRKIRSKQRGQVQLFLESMIELHQSRSSLHILRGATINPKSNSKSLTQDLERFTLASYMSELVLRLSADEQPLPAVYQLLQQSLEFMKKTNHLDLLRSWFTVQLLNKLGTLPNLSECQHCHQSLSESAHHWDENKSELICQQCSSKADLSINTQKLLRALQKYTYNSLEKLDISASEQKKLQDICDSMIRKEIPRGLRTDDFSLHN